MKNILNTRTLKTVFATSLLLLSANSIAETIVIKDATIYTQGADGILEKSSIIIENGEVTAIGDVNIPRGATVIEAAGKSVSPGLISPYSSLGLTEVSAEDSTVDAGTQNESHAAGFDVSSALNPYSTLIPINRIEGITHAISAPYNGHSIFAGQGAAIHLGNPKDADNLLKEKVAMFASISGWALSHAGGSKASAMLELREALNDAQTYADNTDAYESGELRDLSASHLDLQALQAVIDQEIPLVISVNRASQINQALKLVDDFDIRLVIFGGSEAWMLADKIASMDVAVMINPLHNLPNSFDSLGARLDNAALLHKAGVKILVGDGDSHNARNLKQLAGNAVANGLPKTAAFDAISKNVAEVYGLENLGEITVGQQANLVVWDGDPLEITTFADHVFINGQKISMQSRATLLRDRYLSKETKPRAYVKPD